MEFILRTKESRNAAVMAILSLPDDPTHVVSISEYKSKRNAQQNAYYWGVVLKTIADETGDSADAMHEFFKEKFLSGEKIHVLGVDVMVYPSTTKLGVKAFAEYINQVCHFALHELHIYMPAEEYA